MSDHFPEVDIAIAVWRSWDHTYTPFVATVGVLVLLAYLYRKLL